MSCDIINIYLFLEGKISMFPFYFKDIQVNLNNNTIGSDTSPLSVTTYSLRTLIRLSHISLISSSDFSASTSIKIPPTASNKSSAVVNSSDAESNIPTTPTERFNVKRNVDIRSHNKLNPTRGSLNFSLR